MKIYYLHVPHDYLIEYQSFDLFLGMLAVINYFYFGSSGKRRRQNISSYLTGIEFIGLAYAMWCSMAPYGLWCIKWGS